ncbi:MAG: hypothetical protein KKF89_00045 [Nanoarchaeota archaeon]|nr:hypothetical protein [Nanoarchaeota archaeon]
MKFKLVVFLIIGLFVVNIASASFGVYSEKNLLKICRCSELEDTIKIKNTGSQNTIYTLTSNFDFVKITPSEFELSSKAIQDIDLLITAPCESLKKELKIRVRSDKGDDETITKELLIGQCVNLGTKLSVDEEEINPCESVNYQVWIKNTGSFIESYSLNSNFEKYVNFSNKEVEITPGKTAIINATVKLDCSFYGETPINFLVTAQKNQIVSTLTHNLMINQYYAYTLDAKDNYKFCEEEKDSIKVSLENDVQTPNTYHLELEGEPALMKLSADNVSLQGKEKVDVNIEFTEMKKGFYQFKLKSWTEYGDLLQEKNVSVNISDCYDISIDFLDEEREFCAEKKTFTLKLKNNGEEREKIELSVIPDFLYYKQTSVYLNSGEEANVSLFFNPEDKDATYVVKVRATLSNNLSAEDETSFKVLSQGTCHYVHIQKKKYSMRRDSENSFTVKLTNKGKTEEEYSLKISPRFWITLNQSDITLKPGETKKITVISEHTKDTLLGSYPLNLTVKLGNVEYTNGLTVKLKDKSVFVKAYNYCKNNPCHAATIILLFGLVILLLFVIVLNKSPGRLIMSSFYISIVIMILLLVVSGIIIYLYKGVPVLQEPIDYSQVSSTHFIWAQDNVYSVKTSEFVSDPDAEDDLQLNLSEELEHISFSIEEDSMVFLPEEGWYGIENTFIIAKDSKGAFAQSPQITLEVVKRESFTNMQIYNKFCWHINWALLLLDFIMLTILAFKKVRRKPVLLKANKSSKDKKRR